ELVTIASRAVRIDFGPVPTAAVGERLLAEGIEPDRGAEGGAAAPAGRGRPRRPAPRPAAGHRRRARRPSSRLVGGPRGAGRHRRHRGPAGERPAGPHRRRPGPGRPPPPRGAGGAGGRGRALRAASVGAQGAGGAPQAGGPAPAGPGAALRAGHSGGPLPRRARHRPGPRPARRLPAGHPGDRRRPDPQPHRGPRPPRPPPAPPASLAPAPPPVCVDPVHVSPGPYARSISTTADHAVSSRAWVVLLLACLAGVAGALDLSVVFVAFPEIEDAFPDASAAMLSWVLTTYGIVIAALLVPGGRLADLVGRRKVFLTGVAVFGTGALLSGAAPGPVVL